MGWKVRRDAKAISHWHAPSTKGRPGGERWNPAEPGNRDKLTEMSMTVAERSYALWHTSFQLICVKFMRQSTYLLSNRNESNLIDSVFYSSICLFIHLFISFICLRLIYLSLDHKNALSIHPSISPAVKVICASVYASVYRPFHWSSQCHSSTHLGTFICLLPWRLRVPFSSSHLRLSYLFFFLASICVYWIPLCSSCWSFLFVIRFLFVDMFPLTFCVYFPPSRFFWKSQ